VEQYEGMSHMGEGKRTETNAILARIVLAAAVMIFPGFSSCSSPKPAEQPAPAAHGPQRYKLDGRVVSLEPAKQQVTIDAGDIPGFMSAMTMGYAVKNTNLLAPLSPEDHITADVVVNGNDVYLENIVVVTKADNAKPAAGNAAPPAASQPAKQN
jgi:Cu/Ag efflux protein CusF